ncbi:phosphomethylpyrimidine synthase ThiC, partial [Staphylococcus saprophyticus]
AVPFRQIELSDTQLENDAFHNDPITVYDTAGPYHDDNYDVNIDSGIPQLRKSWIDARQDVESYKGRKIQSIDNGFKKEGHKN